MFQKTCNNEYNLIINLNVDHLFTELSKISGC
jgi:hypothetical protein